MKRINLKRLRGRAVYLVKNAKGWYFRPEHRLLSILFTGQFLLVMMAFSTQRQGVILPVGKDVVSAYKLLQTTQTGQRLIKDVKKVTRGSIVFLTLGDTEKDNLFDEYGRTVRGLTRTEFAVSGISCGIRRVTVIANKDILGEEPSEIVKSLAFELENVYQIFALSCACPLQDSPMAALTQARIINELSIYR